MCFFPFANKNPNSYAYKKGITQFDCGCCPECLAKRARLWALRCSAEAEKTQGIMVTLTYDDYKYDRNKRRIGELPPNPNIALDKRHCQLFIKRLRKHFSGIKIKYLLTAERGKRTNRAHYHAILFGIDFDDRIPYKKSDRGNQIYTSATLTKIWGHGICTIDSVRLSAQVARYCTKYCAKDSRADDTFMLVSRGIGDEWLLEHFNGRSYIVDGREYTIPRQIWNKKIEFFYRNNYVYNLRNCSYKYRSLRWYTEKYGDTLFATHLADYNARCRKFFRSFRDSHPLYKRYLEYWKNKAALLDLTRPSIKQRILQLPNTKYFTYKQRALEVLYRRSVERLTDIACDIHLPPRYNAVAQRRKKALEKYRILPLPSCHKGANDTTPRKIRFRNMCVDLGIAIKPSMIPLTSDLQSPFD